MGILDAVQGKRRCNGCMKRKSPTWPRSGGWFCNDCKDDWKSPRNTAKKLK